MPPVRAAHDRLRQPLGIEAERVGIAHAHRDRRDRRSRSRSRPRRATRPRAAPTPAATVRPEAPGGDRIDVPGRPRDCRAARRRRRRRPATLLEHRPRPARRDLGEHCRDRRRRSSLRSASDCPRDRRACPAAAARTRSRCRGAASCSLSRRSVMISSASRARSPRGFRRTRMSPVFCCVANRPSSDPVRRVNAATSGVCCEDRLDRLQTARSVSSSARARRRQVVDDEAAFVGRRAGSRCRRHEQQRRRAPASTSATSDARRCGRPHRAASVRA